MDGISPTILFCGTLYSGPCRRRDFITHKLILPAGGSPQGGPLFDS